MRNAVKVSGLCLSGGWVRVTWKEPAFPVMMLAAISGRVLCSYGWLVRKDESALALLMAWVLADHDHAAMATNHLALVADPLHAGLNLHGSSLSVVRGNLSMNRLLVAVHDTTTVQVVRAKLDDHAVFGQDTDVVLTHLSRNRGKHNVLVLQLDPEHCIRQCFGDRALDFDDTFLFSHVLHNRLVHTAGSSRDARGKVNWIF